MVSLSRAEEILIFTRAHPVEVISNASHFHDYAAPVQARERLKKICPD